jgi:chemotaxis protein CheD
MPTSKAIFVATGEVKSARAPQILISSGIGSCVVISAYCLANQWGVMAHIMLPGRASPDKQHYLNRYAINAIDKLLELIEKEKIKPSACTFTLLGGANVIANSNCKVGHENYCSIKKYLAVKKISIAKESLGGLLRRSTKIDLEQAIAYQSLGNQPEAVFYDYHQSNLPSENIIRPKS